MRNNHSLYNGFSDVSQHTQRRLDEAKAIFTAAREDLEESTAFQNFQVGQIHSVQGLIRHQCHLTSKTWPMLRDFIEDKHPGWKAKRREATDGEDLSGCSGGRGKTYFVDVTYQDTSDPAFKKTNKRRPKHVIEAEKVTKKQRKYEQYENFRKYPKTPFSFFDIVEDAQCLVLEFLDIPTIGALGCASKEFRDLTRKDQVWEQAIKSLLEMCFDDCFLLKEGTSGQPVVPENERPQKLSLRPLRSTSLTNWFHDWISAFWRLDRASRYYNQRWDSKSNFNMFAKDMYYLWESFLKEDNPMLNSESLKVLWVESLRDIQQKDRRKSENHWLFKDVSLFEYYKHAGIVFREGQGELNDQHRDRCEQTNRCFYCFEKVFHHACTCIGKQTEPGFGNTPKIKLFKHKPKLSTLCGW